jgi:hypothetical protein
MLGLRRMIEEVDGRESARSISPADETAEASLAARVGRGGRTDIRG